MPNIRAALILLAVLAGGLSSACGVLETDSDDERPLVIATFTILADIGRQVAGEHLRVESLTKPGAEIHGYEPTPSDLRTAAGADLVVDNGLGLEAWLEQFLESVDAPRITAASGIEPIDVAGLPGVPDPHAWMSPVTAQTYADNLARAFGELVPEHADDFTANAAAYSARLQQMHDDLTDAVQSVPPHHRVLVTCEGAFSYLARDAGLRTVYLWPVNAEQQATPQRIADVVERVRTDEVPAVFCESTVSDQAMRQVVAETGTDFGGTLFVDSLSDPDGPVPTHLDLLEHDVRLIVEGLTGSSS